MPNPSRYQTERTLSAPPAAVEWPTLPEELSLPDAALLLDISPDSLKRTARRGGIATLEKPDGSFCFARAEVERYASRRNKSRPFRPREGNGVTGLTRLAHYARELDSDLKAIRLESGRAGGEGRRLAELESGLRGLRAEVRAVNTAVQRLAGLIERLVEGRLPDQGRAAE